MPPEMMKKIFTGMRLSIHIEPQGKVQKSTATYMIDGRMVLMDIDFDKVLANPEKLAVLAQTKGPSDLTNLAKLMESIPGLRAELKEAVELRFR